MTRSRKTEVPVGITLENTELQGTPTEESHVILHLSRDPNDPRNRPETKTLPSLDD